MLFVAGPIGGTVSVADVGIVWSQNMLGQVAPAVLATLFVRVLRLAELPGDVHCLAPQMDTGRVLDGLGFVIVLGKGHNYSPPVSKPAADKIARLTATLAS